MAEQRQDDGGVGDFRPVPVPQNMMAEVAARTGLPVEQVNPFVVMYAGQPYITKAGLTFKADQRYGVGEYRVVTRFPSLVEYEMALRMMRWPENEPIAIMITDFFLASKPELPLYANLGTASRRNCTTIRGVSNFDKRGLEIAATRSQNRTLRQATNSGFAPIDEVYDGEEAISSVQAHTPEKGGGPYGGFLSRCGELKRDLTRQGRQKDYYRVLRAFGVEHANEVSPGDLDTQMDILVALRELGAIPKKAREKMGALYGEATDAELSEPLDKERAHEDRHSSPDPAPDAAQPEISQPEQAGAAPASVPGNDASQPSSIALENEARRVNRYRDAVRHIGTTYGVTRFSELTEEQISQTGAWLEEAK